MRAALLVLGLAGLYASIGLAEAAQPLGAGCSGKCDKDAAACVDGCEAKHAEDAPKRVACKVECIEKRKSCDAKCQ